MNCITIDIYIDRTKQNDAHHRHLHRKYVTQ